MMRKLPGHTLMVLLTLAIGIGATTAIFTVDYATLLAPLPYDKPDQLVIVWSRVGGVYGGRNVVAAGDFLDWKRQATAFQDMQAWTESEFNVATGDQPDYVEGRANSPGLYQMLGYPFVLGRDFLPEEGQPGKDHVVILTHKYWMRLGSNPNIVGTTLVLNGEPYTVVGVLAPGLTDRGQGEITVPLSFKPEQMNHRFHWLGVMARLKPGVTRKQAQADMDSVTAHLAETYPLTNKGWGARVEPFKNDFIPPESIQMLWLLLGAVGFLLLIACVNVANLLLARGITRQREMAVRSALGGTRGKIFAQLLTESILLSAVGGILGVGVGILVLRGIAATLPPDTLPSEADLSLNLPVLLFTLAATTLAGILFGCAPAWYASRIDPGEALKEGGRSGVGSARQWLRRMLVVGEFALALALLTGAGLTIHSFIKLMRVDPGVSTDHVLTFYQAVPGTRSEDPQQMREYYRRILAEIDTVPGVSNAAVTTGLPLRGGGWGLQFTIVGQPAFADPSQRPGTRFEVVTPDYLRTFDIRVVKGRSFNDQDTASSVKVVLVNEEFAKRYLKGTDALRQRISMEQLIPGVARLGPPAEMQIVGVYRTVRSNNMREDNPEVLAPFWQVPWPSAYIGVHTAQDPERMLPSIAAAVHRVDPNVALAVPRTMEQVRDLGLANDRFNAILFSSFAVVALLLCAVGVYGVMAFSVAQRSREIGLRIALGAGRRSVVSLVLREGMILAGVGIAIGLAGALFVGRSMRSMLYGVDAVDISAFLAVALVLLAAALLACYLPARRAASIEPMEALRIE
jgi:predicted permease